ncbi:amyloid fiber anchoring/assembly protein TapA [Bacillus sp. BHET2]|uniref:amyloid fiber anchoring/assembly protein TapA n=1 Tax=Bacillus sp. BHET2 TaxID=2583818 RepID=UPI0014875C59|nr:amyloid fiber anchoring/assembly protein TapA [Bacillus sp. BHET2]
MIPIRFKRQRKFRNNKNIKLVLELVGIIYLSLFTLSYLTSQTGAYFNDQEQSTIFISSGKWLEEWDKSSLTFTNKQSTQKVSGCGKIEISTIIKNGSKNDMKGTSEYEVYFSQTGNPKDGKKVAEGMVESLQSNQSTTLTYKTDVTGNYKFRAFQRPGHGNKYDERHDLWSETITVTCKETIPDKKEQEKSIEQPITTPEPTIKKEERKAPVKEQRTEPENPPGESEKPIETKKEESDTKGEVVTKENSTPKTENVEKKETPVNEKSQDESEKTESDEGQVNENEN